MDNVRYESGTRLDESGYGCVPYEVTLIFIFLIHLVVDILASNGSHKQECARSTLTAVCLGRHPSGANTPPRVLDLVHGLPGMYQCITLTKNVGRSMLLAHL